MQQQLQWEPVRMILVTLTVMTNCGCQVAEILLELCSSGEEAVAADLLAALANGRGSLTVACNTVVLLVRQVIFLVLSISGCEMTPSKAVHNNTSSTLEFVITHISATPA